MFNFIFNLNNNNYFVKIPVRFNNSRIPLGVQGKNKGSQCLLAKFPILIA